MKSAITKYLTPPEVARRLRVNPNKVLRWLRSGALAGFDVSEGAQRPRFRITPEALADFIASRAIKAKQEPSLRRRSRKQAATAEFF